MNSFDILYQVYRARYSLTRIQDVLDHGYKLALLGSSENTDRIRTYLGEARLQEPKEGEEPKAPPVRVFTLPVAEEDREKLAECQAALVHMGTQIPDAPTLRELAESIPVKVPCMWVVESTDPPPGDGSANHPHVPTIYRLDPEDPGPILCALLIRAYPDLALSLARDFSQLRFHFARHLVRRTSSRNAMLAAASSLPAPKIPVLQFLWMFVATTGETLAITASQIRLCLLMAALHGRPVDFFDRVGELWPIIGSAFGWRTLVREVLGFIPLGGWAFKAGIAYTGTWMVGEASRLFYEMGQPDDKEVLREIQRRSRREAREAAHDAVLGHHEETEVPIPDTPHADPLSDEALTGPEAGAVAPPEPGRPDPGEQP